MKTKLLYLLICLQFAFFAQNSGIRVPGMKCSTCPTTQQPAFKMVNPPLMTATIATHYTMTACGLNYVQTSNALFQRAMPNFSDGLVQPATYSVAGIPPCATILKAFLYLGVVGSGNAVTATIVNPSASSSAFPMTLVGSDVDLCWFLPGSYSYRADVTSIVSGNGNYLISGLPASAGGSDSEGATLFIIYSDPSQAYTGNIVLADGCQGNQPGGCSSTIYGFDVCGTPTLTTNFMLVADMQGGLDVELNFNTPLATPNYTALAASQHIWDFETSSVAPATIGQNTAEYGIFTPGDCVGMMMAGMYYQSDCLTCTTSSPELTVTAVAGTTACPTTATASATGGTGAYTYSWLPTAQTTSAATLQNGTYTLNVSDQTGCPGSTTLMVNVIASTISITSPTVICEGNSISLVAGPAASYTWNPSTYLNVSNSATVVATPMSSGEITYTVDYTDAGGCSNKAVTSLSVSGCTGIEAMVNEETRLLIYPNPSSGNFTVESKTPMNLSLVNVMGQVVKSVELNSKNNNRASVTGVADGVYYFVSKDKSQNIKQKIVVGK